MWRKEKYSSLWKGTVCFGITGTHHGVGVTQICINLSCFLSEICGGRVAVIELSGKNDFERLETELKGDGLVKGKGDHFLVGRTAFYKNIALEKLSEIDFWNYDFCIYDMGPFSLAWSNEFLRCAHKIVVYNMAEWRRFELEKFFCEVNHISGFSEWNYISNLGTRKASRLMVLPYGIVPKTISFMKEPFELTKELIKVYQTII